MSVKTLATQFSGGGGFEAGAVAAGYTPVWGVEYDPEIASVYAANFGPHCIVSGVEDVDYSRLQTPFHHHASPSCKKASVANKERGETPEDIAAAEAVARAIRALQSPNFSLENVWGYRDFESFRIILRALEETGYAFGYWHLNAADYGVPQTRKRLILLASRTHRPRRPEPTHAQEPSAQVDLFGSAPLLKWNGWYAAVEDLIPTLPESKFANWQLKRLPVELAGTILCMTGNTSDVQAAEGVGMLRPEQPANSVYAQPPSIRAFILSNSKTEFSDGVRESDEPMLAVTTQHEGRLRAFIVEGTAAGADNKFTLPVRWDGEPIFTVRGLNPLRAWLDKGRVVKMTPRALARFQSIPNWYVLPDDNSLATTVIGNAVPALFAQRIVESTEGVNYSAPLLNTSEAA